MLGLSLLLRQNLSLLLYLPNYANSVEYHSTRAVTLTSRFETEFWIAMLACRAIEAMPKLWVYWAAVKPRREYIC